MVAGAVPPLALGWTGSVVKMTTRAMFTFYPSSGDQASTFSDKLRGADAAVVKPSLAFWQWLASDESGSRTWQMRGGIKLSALELAVRDHHHQSSPGSPTHP